LLRAESTQFILLIDTTDVSLLLDRCRCRTWQTRHEAGRPPSPVAERLRRWQYIRSPQSRDYAKYA